MTILHITNGDVVAGSLLAAGFTDAILPWRDVLHDGPVPGGMSDAELAETRATFLGSRGWASDAIVRADFAGRDAQLAAAGAGDNVVLWFEPDLYDQLQLMQILARFYIRAVAERPSISIVAADVLLGPLKSNALPAFYETRRAVREVDLELAAQAWEAFTSSNPTLLASFGNTETDLFKPTSYASDATVVLPYVHSAIRRQLEEYPALSNGMSRTDQQTLNTLTAGERTIGETYQASHGPQEQFTWLGDWSYAWYIDRMIHVAEPLLVGLGGVVARPDFKGQREFWEQRVRLSDAGQMVQDARADAIALNGIDRWVGGVHLTSAHHWRWDAVNNTMVEVVAGSPA